MMCCAARLQSSGCSRRMVENNSTSGQAWSVVALSSSRFSFSFKRCPSLAAAPFAGADLVDAGLVDRRAGFLHHLAPALDLGEHEGLRRIRSVAAGLDANAFQAVFHRLRCQRLDDLGVEP